RGWKGGGRAGGGPGGLLGAEVLIRAGGRGLCFGPGLPPAAMAHAIGAAEPLLDGAGHARIEPPPPGLTYVLLVGGPVAHLDIGLERRVVDRAMLDAASARDARCRASTTTGPTSSRTRSRSPELPRAARSSGVSTSVRRLQSRRRAASRSASIQVSSRTPRVAPDRGEGFQSARGSLRDGWRGRSATRQAQLGPDRAVGEQRCENSQHGAENGVAHPHRDLPFTHLTAWTGPERSSAPSISSPASMPRRKS